MISKEEVLRIAKLARLELSGAEAQAMQKDLSSVLDYFEVLKAAPVVEPLQKEPVSSFALRSDAEGESAANSRELVARFPASKDGYLKVKQVL